ncbi:MAG: methyl-accepting chemotaxis protein [Steroidobacteraceae bacterium]
MKLSTQQTAVPVAALIGGVLIAAIDAMVASPASALHIVSGAGLIGFAATGLLGWLQMRRSAHELGGDPAIAVAVARNIAAGEFSMQIAIGAGDTSSLLAALAEMQLSLRSRLQEATTASLENTRIRTALDKVAVGVMLADADGIVVYNNEFSRDIFRAQVSEIRKQLPQFDSESIVGKSIDVFHRTPAHQRSMLAALKTTHTTDIKLGGAVLRIVANPVNGPDGERLGTVVQWIDRTQEVHTEEEVNATVARAIDGDLSARLSEDGKNGFFKALAQGMNQLIENMEDVVRTMSHAAARVSSGANEISRGNLDLSQRTEEQASSLEETAASMEQMTSAVKNNADNATQANQLASSARDQAERGGAVVSSAVAAMSEINAASKKIADIIGVIDEIAFQTNLLALNAAVEAARAGEQGRGFAVVASEVRNLASRSAQAAKEIKTLIQDSVGKVNEGARLVDESGKVLGGIVSGVKKVTDVVAEIAASSREQAAGIEQVNDAVTAMDTVTQQNAALVEEASSAAQALTEEAANLMRLIERYHLSSAPESISAPSPAIRALPTERPKAAPKKSVSPAQDRRTASRPWSSKGKHVSSAAATASPAAAAGGGKEWQDF